MEKFIVTKEELLKHFYKRKGIMTQEVAIWFYNYLPEALTLKGEPVKQKPIWKKNKPPII